MGNPPALLFGVGDRVIHTKTSGRIRGKVVEIRIMLGETEATIVVDGLNRECAYDARNLALEPEDRSPHPIPETKKENDHGGIEVQ